jgi:excisionase family DNA binding protein
MKTPSTPKRHANTNTMDLPLCLSAPQVAEITGLSEKTINRRIHDGSLPAKRLGPRVLRIHRDSLLAWLGAS